VTGENVLEECDACLNDSRSTRDEILHLIATFPSQGAIEDKTPYLLEILILLLKEPVEESVKAVIKEFIESCVSDAPEIYEAFVAALGS